jgi:hypothetical protein
MSKKSTIWVAYNEAHKEVFKPILHAHKTSKRHKHAFRLQNLQDILRITTDLVY